MISRGPRLRADRWHCGARLAIQVRGILLGRTHIGARGERFIRACQQALHHLVAQRSQARLSRTRAGASPGCGTSGLRKASHTASNASAPMAAPPPTSNAGGRLAAERFGGTDQRFVGHDVGHAECSCAVPAPRGLDEQSDSLLGNRLVQEAVDGAVGDLRGQRALIVDACRQRSAPGPGTDDFRRSVSFSIAAGDGRCIQDRNTGVFCDELSCQIRLGAHREDIVIVSQHLQRFHQRAVGAQHDEAFARSCFGAWKRAHDRSSEATIGYARAGPRRRAMRSSM